MITNIILWFLSLFNMINNLFGLHTFNQFITDTFSQISNTIGNTSDIFSIVFYFVPKTEILWILGIVGSMLLFRIIMALINLIWW